MAINPELITTIRVDQLPDDVLTLDSLFPHTVGTSLKSSTIQELVDLVATAVDVSGGVGFLALSVTDGQQLPNVPENPSFFLCGSGTFLNINGFPNIICTENLNAIMSLTDHWELAVEIPIAPLSGTVESVTGSAVDNTDPLNPVINTTGTTPPLTDVLTEGNTTDGNNIEVSNGDAIEMHNASLLRAGSVDNGFGGGISRVCAVGYESEFENGVDYYFPLGGNYVYAKSVNGVVPNETFDNTKNWAVGSYYYLANENELYKCTDATTGSAVWELQSVGATPNLEQVLTVGNRGLKDISASATYDLIEEDKGKTLVNSFGSLTTINLNADGFLDGDEIEILNAEGTDVELYNNTDGLYILYNGSSILYESSVTIPLGSKAILKYLGAYYFALNIITVGGSGGATNLGYTPSPTNGIVTSDTGTDATIPLADSTNSGLLSPSEKTAISVINKTSVKLAENITKGQAVYISSATGTNIIVSKASNTSEATSSKVLGLLETTGVTNDIVNVITFELIKNINTSTATVGDAVWLGTSGNLIFGLASKPVAPAHLVYIGVVTRVSATVGEIFVNIQNGFELNEIHDVLLTSLANNQALVHESATLLWKNKTIDKTFVGLGNVDNTSDVNKPVSTAQQTAIDAKVQNSLSASTTVAPSATAVNNALNNRRLTLFCDTPATSVTGVTVSTLFNVYRINGGTLTNYSKLLIDAQVSKSGGLGVSTFQIFINSSNNFATATEIGRFNLTTTVLYGSIQRGFVLKGGNITGFPFTSSSVTDFSSSTVAWSSTPYNLANDLWAWIAIDPNSTTETHVLESVTIEAVLNKV